MRLPIEFGGKAPIKGGSWRISPGIVLEAIIADDRGAITRECITIRSIMRRR